MTLSLLIKSFFNWPVRLKPTTKQMHAKCIDVLCQCSEHVDDDLRAQIKAAVIEYCDTNNCELVEFEKTIDFRCKG